MYRVLRGAPVRDAIAGEIRNQAEELISKGVQPSVATLRVGDNAGDCYYEKAVRKNSEKYGIHCRNVVFPDGTPQEEIELALMALNDDPGIHGILMLMPFPKGVDSERLRSILDPAKDIDAITDASYAYLFDSGKTPDQYFCACTAESCMEILQRNGIGVSGKKVTIIGRSVRVGKPLMLMMLNANATVTVCHTRTKAEDRAEAIRSADIVVLATGQIESFGPDDFRDGQIIVDAGAGTGADGKMAGDLNFRAIEEAGKPADLFYTPVPGGVGTVNTTLLLRNVVRAAAGTVNGR